MGEIKRALHELAHSSANSAAQDKSAVLREVQLLLRQLALSQGIDPEKAVRQRLAAVKALRERMVLASPAASGRNSG